tara:strand:+ start:302 stop:757 length:456 start_codon:yes stop_codon:yes gene_type:complete
MSFFGNLAAARSAKAFGEYNNRLYQQQAAYQREKAAVNLATYNKVKRPLFVKNLKRNYSNFFVNALRTGAEFREGTSPYIAGLEFKINQATDLTLADYNAEMDQQDQNNQASLLVAKGQGELFKGKLTAQTERVKAVGSLLSTGYDMGYIG